MDPALGKITNQRIIESTNFDGPIPQNFNTNKHNHYDTHVLFYRVNFVLKPGVFINEAIKTLSNIYFRVERMRYIDNIILGGGWYNDNDNDIFSRQFCDFTLDDLMHANKQLYIDDEQFIKDELFWKWDDTLYAMSDPDDTGDIVDKRYKNVIHYKNFMDELYLSLIHI